MKSFDIKVGSVMFWKQYNVFKRLWAWITGKKLPYNKWALFTTDLGKSSFPFQVATKVYEPVKPYTNKELKKLETLATQTVIADVIADEDLKLIINCVRPNTIHVDGGVIDGDWLAGNKYYKKCNEKTK